MRLDAHHCEGCEGAMSRAYDINDLFNVVGWAEIRPEGETESVRRAFIWSPLGIGSVVPAEDVHPIPHWSDGSGYDPDFDSEARGINVLGQVAGWGRADTGSLPGDRAFLWLPAAAFGFLADVMNDLGTLAEEDAGTAQAHDLTDRQDPLLVVGVTWPGAGEPSCDLSDAFAWSPTSMSELEPPGSWFHAAAYGTAPRRSPTVPAQHAGRASDCVSSLSCKNDMEIDAPTRWSPEQDLEASIAGGRRGVAHDATDDGLIVGAIGRKTPPSGWSECALHAAVWAPPTMAVEFLPMPDAEWQLEASEAFAIEPIDANSYRIVGWNDDQRLALVWEGSPGAWTVAILDDLTSIGAGATTCGFDRLIAAHGVSRTGAIVGYGDPVGGGVEEAFLLVPLESCPEDHDRDGEVGFTDLTAVLGNWNAVCPAHEICDLPDSNADCVVNLTDQIAVLANWGPCGEASLLSGLPGLAETWLLIGGQDALFAGQIGEAALDACFTASDSALEVFASLCQLLASEEVE